MISIDNSRIDTFNSCPQLFDFLYNYEVDDGDSNWKANFSTWMIHLPCQEWYASGGVYKPNWQILLKTWNPTQEEMLSDKYANYTVTRAARLFDEFVEKAMTREDLVNYEYLDHEQYVERRLAPDVRPWGAKTDLLMRHKESGDKHAFEIKASRWDYILTGIQFNRQILGEIYVNGATKAIVIFFNLNAKKNEDGVIFIEIEPTSGELEQWRESTIQEVETLERSYEMNIWPKRTAYCKRFNTTCSFLDMCTEGGTASPRIVDQVKAMPKRDSLAYLTTADVNVKIVT